MAADGFKENQTVGAAPVDDECALSSPQIVGDRTFHTVILIRMSQNGLVRLIVAQHLCHVLSHQGCHVSLPPWSSLSTCLFSASRVFPEFINTVAFRDGAATKCRILLPFEYHIYKHFFGKPQISFVRSHFFPIFALDILHVGHEIYYNN